MKVIFISDNGRHHYKLAVSRWLFIVMMLLLLATAILFTTNYNRIFSNTFLSYADVTIIDRFDSYLKRLAMLEAQTLRLNALGARIAKSNNIDIDAFLLEKRPAQGGIVNSLSHISVVTEQNLIKSIRETQLILEKKEKVFNFYKDLNIIVKNKKLLDSYPEYRYVSPVKKGYISSNYGYRRDPINGKHRNHRGVDIAGRTGSLINPITSGFVSFTGWKGGYGKVVEVQHSNSLKSRYAHLSTISVKKGQVVRKGDTIAKMGSTGRVTGPHLHLEVWKNGKTVNPNTYLKDALGNLSKR